MLELFPLLQSGDCPEPSRLSQDFVEIVRSCHASRGRDDWIELADTTRCDMKGIGDEVRVDIILECVVVGNGVALRFWSRQSSSRPATASTK